MHPFPACCSMCWGSACTITGAVSAWTDHDGAAGPYFAPGGAICSQTCWYTPYDRGWPTTSFRGKPGLTAPLWDVGQRLFFLHDGRTSDLLQAIMAHRSNASGNKLLSTLETVDPAVALVRLM